MSLTNKSKLNTSSNIFCNMLGKSKIMHQLFNKIREVASCPNTTVLIIGESGTGKELVARAIHNSC